MKRTAPAFAAIAAAALVLIGCTDAGGAEPEGEVTTVRIGYLASSNDTAQMFTAINAGYFEEEGIKVELTPFQTGITIANALTGGSIDVGVMGAVIANFPAKGQGKVFVLNNIQTESQQIWAQGDSDITSVADLRGRTVATTAGTAANIMLETALEANGMTQEDVELVNLDMPAVANTFITKGVDAAALWAPFDVQVEKNNPSAVLLATASDFDVRIAGGWVANNRYYESNRDTLVKLTRGWQKANADLVASPEETVREMVCPDLEDFMTIDVCADVYLKSTAYSNEEWQGYYADGTAVGWVARLQEVFERIGALDGASVDAVDYVDASIFVDAADG